MSRSRLMFVVALPIVAIVLCVWLIGCSTQLPFCSLLQSGISAIESELASGEPDIGGEFDSFIAPALKAKDMSDIVDNAETIWNQIPTEAKLKAALDVLNYLNNAYCTDEGAVATQQSAKLHVLNILSKAKSGR